jgi:hypothetical protein
LPHLHDFEKCFDRTSANLLQVCWRNPHPHLLGEQFDQHHDAALAVGHLVDGFDTCKGLFRQADPFTWFEQALGLRLNTILLRPQGFDQAVGRLGRLHPKTHQPADALGRTDRRPTRSRIFLAQTH